MYLVLPGTTKTNNNNQHIKYITIKYNIIKNNQTMTGTIIERVRASGKCPPSLIRDVADNKFEAAVEKVVDSNGEY